MQSYENKNKRLLMAIPKLEAYLLSEIEWLTEKLNADDRDRPQSEILTKIDCHEMRIKALRKYGPLISTNWKHNWESDIFFAGGAGTKWLFKLDDVIYPNGCTHCIHIFCCITTKPKFS